MAHEGGTRATIAALAANIGIAVAKFIAYAFTMSPSMLAEGIHSVADTSNQALLLFGVNRSKRGPTQEHPFGFGRERYFWAFMVAVVLFTLGAVLSIIEGISKVRHPEESSSLTWAIGVLVVSIILESFSLRTAVQEANVVRTTGWWGFIRTSKSPELIVLVLEDTGALLGLIFALGGIVASHVFHEPRFDAVGSLAIGVLLGAIALVLATELRSLLIGEAVVSEQEDAIRDAITSERDVHEVIHMRTLHIGPEHVLVAAKVRFDDELHMPEIAAAIDRVEAEIRQRVPIAQTIYIEPDIRR